MALIFSYARHVTRILARGVQFQRNSLLHHQSQGAPTTVFCLQGNRVPSKPVSPPVILQTPPIASSGSTLRYTSQSNFSTFTSVVHGLRSVRSSPSSAPLLEVPRTPILTQTCGMKLKGVLNKRCKHCEIAKRRGNIYVLCEENPRHKQKLIKKKGYYLPGVWANKWY